MSSAGAVAVSGALMASAGQADAEVADSEDTDYDVIVLGGGFAGVTAARDSCKNGYSTLILESRNRLGGRTFTSEFEGHAVDLGGTWIHWSQPAVWAEKERYSLEIIETPGFVPDRMIANADGHPKEVSLEDYDAIVQAYLKFTAHAREIWERPYDVDYTLPRIVSVDDMSAADYIESLSLPAFESQMLASLVATCAHNTSENMSYVEALRWFSCGSYNDFPGFLDTVGRFKFRDGTQALLNAMLEDGGADVSLSSVVTRVEDTGQAVRVTTNDGMTRRARAVISTIPMNVLTDVEFEPALPPGVAQAAQERHTGIGQKVYAKTSSPVGNILLFGGEADAVGSAWTYRNAEDHTILVIFNNAPDKLDMTSRHSVEAGLRKFLPDISVTAVKGYDWNSDPFSRGTYPSYRPGWFGKYLPDFQKDQGRILMASGDHGEGWRGFIDGAIREGSKAAIRARQILG